MPTALELMNEADQLRADGKLAEAVDKLKQALEVEPGYTLAHSALAVTLQRLGQHEEAIAHAKQACDLAPDDPFSFTALSVTCQRAYAGTGDQKYIPMAEDAMERSRILQSQR